jgi:hypothetical protein
MMRDWSGKVAEILLKCRLTLLCSQLWAIESRGEYSQFHSDSQTAGY